jgi:hypothetical protein
MSLTQTDFLAGGFAWWCVCAGVLYAGPDGWRGCNSSEFQQIRSVGTENDERRLPAKELSFFIISLLSARFFLRRFHNHALSISLRRRKQVDFPSRFSREITTEGASRRNWLNFR